MRGRQSGGLITALLSSFLYLAAPLPAVAEWFSEQQAVMGTSVSVTLWHADPDTARKAMDAVFREMQRIDAHFSPFREDSELARANRQAAQGPIAISSELATLIDKSLYYSRISEGAFDISFASLGRHYDYRHERQPGEGQRRALLPAIDFRLIELDRSKLTLAFKHPQLQVDLGGIAKGYAVDRSIAILEQFGVEHGTVSAGGDSRVLGSKDGDPWIIGIKKPRGQPRNPERTDDGIAIRVPLVNTAISTSGDYERYFIDGQSGERIHHILNPRTGKSATGVVSVSILGPRAFDTDPLSTTVFVLGVERGLTLINRLPSFDAIIIDSAGQVHYSEGLAPGA